MHLKFVIPAVFLLLLHSGAASTAIAAPVELQAIQIRPVEVTSGKHPEIIGTIRSKTYDETITVNIIASITGPDNAVRTWKWEKILVKPDETKGFSVPKEYDIQSAGVYKVEFSVFSLEMQPLSKGMNRFIVSAAPLSAGTTTTPTTPKTGPGGAGVVTAKKAARRPADYPRFGLGVQGNVVNGAGGATMQLWPFKQVGLQAGYTMGYFTTTEGRLLVRFPRATGVTPYFGVGFTSVSTERTVEVVNITTKFSDSGVSGALGVELPLRKNIKSYFEISGAAIDLKKEVTDGTLIGTAEILYSPVTVSVGVVFFLF